MNELKASSLQSLLESDHGSIDSLLAESLVDLEELDDAEYSIPPMGVLPSLETVLSEFDADSDITSELGMPVPTPTPSLTDESSVRLNSSGGCGSIMRFALLQGISTQLASAADRINAGYASSCSICSYYYAVGTSHGHLLNFDTNQTLRWAYQDKNGQGAISAIDYNCECSRLLAGFARGLILMLDTQNGNVMRQLNDAITPNTGVLHMKWTSRPAIALAADSGGSVWCLNFTRKLGVRGCTSRCLFSGARGEVCTVEPLIKLTHDHHDLDQYCIVALATLSKYFIVTIRPRLKVIKYHMLQGPPDCLPLLAWQMVLIQAADTTRSIDPVLVVGRGQQLFFHQLFVAQGRVTLLLLRNIIMPSNLLSVHWLGPKCVACLDTSEILHLMDVRSSKELECIDLGNANLVYGSAQFKGLATGGNVSPALALAGSHACYNSLTAKGVHLFILGARTMHSISVRTWMERISYLVKNQRWQQACDLALEGYRTAIEKPKRKQQAKERIIMLFKEYLAASARAPDYCLGSIIKCLITVGEMDLLWSQLWERLQNKALFLQHITEHIKNEDVHYVNPTVSQALVDYWLNISPLRLEEILLKMDWRCLDLNQVLRAAKSHKMYRAQIYLNSQALHDYTISLTELIPLLNEYNAKELHTDLGNCILVYISSCLAGRGYPTGDIPEQYVQTVKHDVLRCLTSLHSNLQTFNDDGSSNELPYPYLRTLLKFDTRETLNVISLAFQEKEFHGDLGYLHRKRIINILLEIMTPANATWCEIGCLLNFIAQQISHHCLPCDAELLRKILNYLSMECIENETERMHMERENAWHELLVNNCLNSITNDEEQLDLARRAHCYFVVEYLLEKLKRFDNILECYLNNVTRHEAMFVYMERNIYDPKRRILEQLKQHLKSLLRIDAKECTRIIHIHFSGHINEFLDELMNDDDEILMLSFLKCLHDRNVALDTEQIEMLLQLLCKYEPNEVEEFLHHLDINTYRLDKAMDIVKRYDQLMPASIYLAEKQGDYRLAFDMAMEQLKNRASTKDDIADQVHFISLLCSRCSMAINTSVNTNTTNALKTNNNINNNNKNNNNNNNDKLIEMSMMERDNLWFELLDYVLSRDDLKAITKTMLQQASAYVNLNNLVQLVLNSRNMSSGDFGDIKELLISMLLQAKQETITRESVCRILEMELNNKFHRKRDTCNRGLWITMLKCVWCHKRLINHNCAGIIVLGNCGHAMHDHCSNEYIEQFHTSNKNTNNIINHNDYNNDDHNEDNDESNDDGTDIHKCLYCLREFHINSLQQPLQWQKYSATTTTIATKYCNGDMNCLSHHNHDDDNNYRSSSMLGVLQLKAPPGNFSKGQN